MSDLTAARRFIQEQETRYKAAVSEAVAQKMGEMMNFLAKRQFDHLTFYLNGPHYIIAAPQTGVDGLFVVPWDSEITNVAVFNLVDGTAGTLELDVKRATASGGAFTSIFSTTPKISHTAGNSAYGLSYDIADGSFGQTWAPRAAPSGVTLGVLSSTPFNLSAGDALRLDKLGDLTGGQNAGVIIFHRPR